MKHTTTTILAALALTGCGDFNPCESALFNGLNPDQQASCMECNNYKGCEQGEDEVGDGDGDILTCEVQVGEATINGWDPAPWRRVMCLVGEHPTAIDANGPIQWPDLEIRNANTCGSLSKPFPCRRQWTHPSNADGDMCVMCEPQVDPPGPATDRPPMLENHGWRLCGYENVPDWTFGLWRLSYYLDDEIGGVGWQNWLTCTDADEIQHFACPKTHIGIETFQNTLEPISQVDLHTCICETDEDCQPGAVCEAGWDPGQLPPKPTICTWDDGTPNGVAPEGPIVYGLDSWDDGLTIDGDTIYVSTPMFIEATIGGAGLWNDGQRFGVLDLGLADGTADIEVTACDERALCGHLGLAEGDVLGAPVDAFEALTDGLPVDVNITSLDGSWRMLRVQVI